MYNACGMFIQYIAMYLLYVSHTLLTCTYTHCFVYVLYSGDFLLICHTYIHMYIM